MKYIVLEIMREVEGRFGLDWIVILSYTLGRWDLLGERTNKMASALGWCLREFESFGDGNRRSPSHHCVFDPRFRYGPSREFQHTACSNGPRV